MGLAPGNLVALLQQDAADPLEADGETNGGDLHTQELAHHVVIASAASYCAAELRAGDLEHHAGVVALAAHQAGAVSDLILVLCQSRGGRKYILQLIGNGGVGAAGSHSVQRDLSGSQKVCQSLNCLGGELFFGQLSPHALGAESYPFCQR